MLSKTVTLTDDDIKALPTTPFIVVPAPGVGKTLMFFGAFKLLGPVPITAYENIDPDGYAGIGFGVDNTYLSAIVANDSGASLTELNSFLGASAHALMPLDRQFAPWHNAKTNYGNAADYENQPMIFWCYSGLGDFTGGDPGNSMTITTFYAVVDV